MIIENKKLNSKLTYSLLILVYLFFPSCITKHTLIKQDNTKNISKSNINTINGTYYNNADSTNSIKLWAALFYCKSFKSDTTKISDSAVVNIKFENKNRLTATLIDHGKEQNKIILKCKSSNELISIKRNLRLIPIPFLFFNYHEAKALLFINNENSLHISFKREQFLWILFAGGTTDRYNNSYLKTK